MFGLEKARVYKKEADFGKLGVKAREKRREGLTMARKILVAVALIVVELANLAVFELSHCLPLLIITSVALLLYSCNCWVTL